MNILITFVLAKIKYKHHFFKNKKGAYKICKFCKSREDLKKYNVFGEKNDVWVCKTCFKDFTSDPTFPYGCFEDKEVNEEMEVSADLHRKYEVGNEDDFDPDEDRKLEAYQEVCEDRVRAIAEGRE